MTHDTVYLYVLDSMADWEPGFATAELHSGRFFRPGAPRLRVRVCAATREPVTSMGGLRIVPVLPADWQGFTAVRVFRGVRYEIKCARKGAGNSVRLSADGVALNGTIVPLPMAGTDEVRVEVTLE